MPVSLVFLIFPEELVLLTSGAEFEPGADALRLLAPYPLLSFVNALLWRVMIAAGHDRTLLAIAASVLTLNVALNVALLPAYGFRAASVNVVVTEVFSIAVSASCSAAGRASSRASGTGWRLRPQRSRCPHQPCSCPSTG